VPKQSRGEKEKSEQKTNLKQNQQNKTTTLGRGGGGCATLKIAGHYNI
jgi:hypothetical protein